MNLKIVHLFCVTLRVMLLLPFRIVEPVPQNQVSQEQSAPVDFRCDPVLPKASTMKDRRFIKRVQINDTASFSVVTYNLMADEVAEGDASNTLPQGYWRNLLTELSNLQPDIFCLQSMTKLHRYVYRIEEHLQA